jgi:hypothetical protein
MVIGSGLSRAAAAVLCTLGVACGDPDVDATPFVGEFEYAEGEVSALCQGVRRSESVVGIRVDVMRSGGGLDFVVGPRCRVWLKIDGDVAYATAGQRCELAYKQTIMAAVFDEFTATASAGTLAHHATGFADLEVPDSIQIPCEVFTLSGTLTPRVQ